MFRKKLYFLWSALLFLAASFVIVNVNFGFKEDMLREELIEHSSFKINEGSLAVCPVCGNSGFAYCSRCGKPMMWNSAGQYFICRFCKLAGRPVCAKCKSPMTGKGPGSVDLSGIINRPVPVF